MVGRPISWREATEVGEANGPATAFGDERDEAPARPRITASERVYNGLRDDIMMGRLVAGQLLQPADIAKSYGASTVPVREALLRLKAERLVDAEAYRRYVVRSFDGETLVELLDIRCLLEVFGLRRAPITPERLADLTIIHHAMVQAESLGSWLELDKRFHAVLCDEASETAFLVRQLRDQIQQYVTRISGARDRRQSAEAEHWRIIEALRNDDRPEATRLLADHVQATRDKLADAALPERGAAGSSARLTQQAR